MGYMVFFGFLFFLYLVGRSPGILIGIGKGLIYIFVIPALVIGGLVVGYNIVESINITESASDLFALAEVIVGGFVLYFGFKALIKWMIGPERPHRSLDWYDPSIDHTLESAYQREPHFEDKKLRINLH